VPDVKQRDVDTTPVAAAAAGSGVTSQGGQEVTSQGGHGVTSQGEDVLDVIDRLSQTTPDEERHQLSLFNVDDEIFPV